MQKHHFPTFEKRNCMLCRKKLLLYKIKAWQLLMQKQGLPSEKRQEKEAPMTSEAKQFHCPNCYADLKFSPGQQNFACEYCRSSFTEAEVIEFQRRYMEQEQQYDPNRGQMPPEMEMNDAERRERERFQEETNLYSCPSCGAEIMSDANTAAAFCYYCHNPVILKGRVDGMYRPSMVLPFGFDKDMAVNHFKTWAKSKWFIPKDLVSSVQIEKLTGLYVPFWVAHSTTSSRIEAIGEDIRSWTSGNYRYTETKSYRVIRDARINYEGVPADGSQKIEDLLMEAIEPFDYTQARPFNMAYLSGFYADKYDVDKEQVLPRIQQRMYENNARMLESTVHHNRITSKRQFDRTDALSWDYMLLPVWFMTFDYKGKLWEYAVNGQSGKVAGELPIDKGKLAAVCLLVSLLAALAIFFGGYLFGGAMA